MPIYEYKCNDCGTEFEQLVFKSDEEVKCPTCDSSSVTKLLSATSSRGTGNNLGAGLSSLGSSCGGGGGFS